MDTLVDVLVDDDDGESIQLAKVVSVAETTYSVCFLGLRESGFYQYDDTPVEIDMECIDGFYDSTDEKDAGFIQVVQGCYQPIEEYDDDYVPSDAGSDTDESVVDSDMESEEENIEEY